MSTFSLTDETAIDVLIFWIESSDGSISYQEEEAVKRVMDTMDYDMDTYHETLRHLSALSTESLKEVEEEALDYVNRNFSDSRQKLIYQLLENIASSDGKPTKREKEKLEYIKNKMIS